jgi:hypothetical protein
MDEAKAMIPKDDFLAKKQPGSPKICRGKNTG